MTTAAIPSAQAMQVAETNRSLIQPSITSNSIWFKLNETTGNNPTEEMEITTITENQIDGTNVGNEIWTNAGWFTPSSADDNSMRLEQEVDELFRLDTCTTGILVMWDYWKSAHPNPGHVHYGYGKPLGGSTTLGGYNILELTNGKLQCLIFGKDGTQSTAAGTLQAIPADSARHSIVNYIDMANRMSYIYVDGDVATKGVSVAITELDFCGVSANAEGDFGMVAFGRPSNTSAITRMQTTSRMKNFFAMRPDTDISASIADIAQDHYANEGLLPWGLEGL